MKDATNLITISGVVSEINGRFVTIKSKRADGRVIFIEVWNVQVPVNKGQSITVLGCLDLRRALGPADKMILGVKAYNVWFKDEKANVVTVIGEIFSRKKLVHLSANKDSLSFRLKLSNGNVIPVVAFDYLARELVRSYSLGDTVRIGGVLVSRLYDKVVDENHVTKMTTEVVVEAMEKVPKEEENSGKYL